MYAATIRVRLRCLHRQHLRDRRSGLLRVALSGDLVGWSQFRLTSAGTATVADYRQEVDLSRFAALARPFTAALRWNHSRMMRSGERGLRTRLAGTG